MLIENKPPPFKAPKPANPPPKWKEVLAFFLGLLSLFPGFWLSQALGGPAAFAGMGAYFLIAQYLLSRGNPYALIDDWGLVAAMNSTLLCILFVAGQVELLLLVMVTGLCSCAGAGLASVIAMARQDRLIPTVFRADPGQRD